MTWNAKQNPIDGNWLVMDGDEPILNFYRDKDIADSVVMIVREAIEESEAENKRLRDALEKARMHGGEVEAICCMALSAEKPVESEDDKAQRPWPGREAAAEKPAEPPHTVHHQCGWCGQVDVHTCKEKANVLDSFREELPRKKPGETKEEKP